MKPARIRKAEKAQSSGSEKKKKRPKAALLGIFKGGADLSYEDIQALQYPSPVELLE